MSESDFRNELHRICKGYSDRLTKEFDSRIENVCCTHSGHEEYEVLGGILSRQVTLALQFAHHPSMLNIHIGPIVLRSMVDSYITLSWIILDSEERCRKFRMYGIGQEKLFLEHIKSAQEDEDYTFDYSAVIDHLEQQIESQRRSELTEVDIGSWSGKSTRDMANEAKCMDVYRYAYFPFSAATHGMWNHIRRCNLIPCSNPLHGLHLIPKILPSPLITDFLYRAAKYARMSLDLIDNHYGLQMDSESAFKYLESELFEEEGQESDESAE